MNNLTSFQERYSTPRLTCVCGAKYSESDGACHAHCCWCHVVTPMEELDEYEVCISCRSDKADRDYDRIQDSLMMQAVGDCPECGSVTIGGKCTNKARH